MAKSLKRALDEVDKIRKGNKPKQSYMEMLKRIKEKLAKEADE